MWLFLKLWLNKMLRNCRSSDSNEISLSSSLDLESDINGSSWSKKHIPQEIMERIMQKLGLNEQICMASTCSSWRSHVSTAIASKQSSSRTQFPLLILFAHPLSEGARPDLEFYNLQDKLSANYVTVRIQQRLKRRHCAGRVEGWMIVNDHIKWRPEAFSQYSTFENFKDYFGFISGNIRNYMLNPITGTRFMLPSHSNIPGGARNSHYFFRKVVASSVPTCPHCIVAAITNDSDLVFCRPLDPKWVFIDKKDSGINIGFRDIQFVGGNQLYALVFAVTDFLMVYELNDRDHWPGYKVRKLMITFDEASPVDYVAEIEQRNDFIFVKFSNYTWLRLVSNASTNELFLIERTGLDHAYKMMDMDQIGYVGLSETTPKTNGFRVFKLKQVENDDGYALPSARWELVDSLGNDTLFLSNKSYEFVSLDASTNMGFEKNCIYLATEHLIGRDNRFVSTATQVEVFSLDNGMTRQLISTLSPGTISLLPVWFTPKFW